MARLTAEQIAAAIDKTRLRRDEAIRDLATMLGSPEIRDFVDAALLCRRAVRGLDRVRQEVNEQDDYRRRCGGADPNASRAFMFATAPRRSCSILATSIMDLVLPSLSELFAVQRLPPAERLVKTVGSGA